MKIPKDTLNTKYMLQHLGSYPTTWQVFIAALEDASAIAPVVGVKKVNLREDGCSLGNGPENAFILISGEGEPLTVEGLKKALKGFPKTLIAVMDTPEENSISTIVSSQTMQVKINPKGGFNMVNMGPCNSVLFGYSED